VASGLLSLAMVLIGGFYKQTKKNKNMKQLLSLFLFLIPCLALAQYPSNGNQKITLGEQTTADGLIYRGVAATDTVRKSSVDTMAYMVLDTTTNIIWHYKKATSNAWLRIGGSISSGLTGTLPVANGGTNTSTAFTAGSVVFAGSGGTYTQDNSNLFWNKDKYNFGVGVIPTNSSDGLYSHLQLGESGVIAAYYSGASLINFGQNFYNNGGWKRLAANSSTQIHLNTGEIEFRVAPTGSTNSAITWTAAMNIDNTGKIGLGISSPTEKLHVVGNARISAMNGIGDIGADANGVLQAATSDMNLKNTIENSPFGLNEILLLNPVTFLYNDLNRKLDSDVKEVGFIAQDVFDIIPNAISSTGTGDLQLDYRAITATLVKAMQEQQALIKALEQRIINLENK
jgi:hypothetical protein